jgi:hypothetical protein
MHQRLAEELAKEENEEGFNHASSVGPARRVRNRATKNPGREDRGSERNYTAHMW